MVRPAYTPQSANLGLWGSYSCQRDNRPMLITDTTVLYAEYCRHSSLWHVKCNQETLLKAKKRQKNWHVQWTKLWKNCFWFQVQEHFCNMHREKRSLLLSIKYIYSNFNIVSEHSFFFKFCYKTLYMSR